MHSHLVPKLIFGVAVPGLIALAVSVPLTVRAQVQGARILNRGTDILKSWEPGQHLYIKGEVGVDPLGLAGLESWLDANGANWTVLLVEQANGEIYRDADGYNHSGAEAIEYAVGRGLPGLGGFAALQDPRTGQGNGAALVIHTPAVGEDLSHQTLGATAGGGDLIEVGMDDRRRWHVGANHFHITENARQDVIEVMRDASGQGADRFHFLGLLESVLLFAKLLCGAESVRNVAADTLDLRLPEVILNHLAGEFKNSFGTVLTEQVNVGRRERTVATVGDIKTTELTVIFTAHHSECRKSEHLLGGVSESSRSGGVHHQIPASDVAPENDVMGALEQVAIVPLQFRLLFQARFPACSLSMETVTECPRPAQRERRGAPGYRDQQPFRW